MISKAALSLLEWLSKEEDDHWGYDRELVHEGRTWMAGTKRIPRCVVDELILFCCISIDGIGKDKFERWAINGTGRDMLVNPEKTCREVTALLGYDKRGEP